MPMDRYHHDVEASDIFQINPNKVYLNLSEDFGMLQVQNVIVTMSSASM